MGHLFRFLKKKKFFNEINMLEKIKINVSNIISQMSEDEKLEEKFNGIKQNYENFVAYVNLSFFHTNKDNKLNEVMSGIVNELNKYFLSSSYQSKKELEQQSGIFIEKIDETIKILNNQNL